MGPSPEDPVQVQEAYDKVMALLKADYEIQSWPIDPKFDWSKERTKLNAEFREALRKLFELDMIEKW